MNNERRKTMRTRNKKKQPRYTCQRATPALPVGMPPLPSSCYISTADYPLVLTEEQELCLSAFLDQEQEAFMQEAMRDMKRYGLKPLQG